MLKPNPCHPLLAAVITAALAAATGVAQMDWKKLSPATSPPWRNKHAMAYDAARQETVLFGGTSGHDVNDTWVWDGKTWRDATPKFPNPSPSARKWHAMAYDAVRRRIVLFGGTTGGDETWEWDGTTWSKHAPTIAPPSRYEHAMAYDAARKRVVLFGGYGKGNATWFWDGKTWTQRTPTPSPSARSCHAMAYDAARGRVVLFGGLVMTWPRDRDDTWEWDGMNWTQCAPATKPPPRGCHAMAYDAARQRVVLFGSPIDNDTWEWDGRNWAKSAPVTKPPSSVSFHAMAYDVVRGTTVMFGGVSNRDTWAYASTDLIASLHFVSVAAGGNVILSLNAGTMHAAKDYWVVGCVDGSGTRGIALGPKVTLLLYPDPYFVWTVSHPNALIANSQGELDDTGRGMVTVRVPKLPAALIGCCFYHAYVVYQLNPLRIDYASTPVPLTLVK